MSTTTLTWKTEETTAEFAFGTVVIDTALTSTTPDGEPLMISSYARDRSRVVLTVGTRDLGPFDTTDEAKAAAELL